MLFFSILRAAVFLPERERVLLEQMHAGAAAMQNAEIQVYNSGESLETPGGIKYNVGKAFSGVAYGAQKNYD